MDASTRAAQRWGVLTTTAAMFDVVVTHSGRYSERCRCSAPDEAMRYALRRTLGRPRAVADVWNPHLGITASVGGRRTDLADERESTWAK